MLSDLKGRGWVLVQPPLQFDDENVVARYEGKPIRAGFLMERVRDTDSEVHVKYRSGSYDLEVKIDLETGHGQVRVEEAPGYDNEKPVPEQ